jgi:antitoxin MazE
MKVSRWGGSLAVRLPKAVVERLGVREGDDVVATVIDENSFVIETGTGGTESEGARRERLLGQIRALRVNTGDVEYRFERSEMADRYAGRGLQEE